MADVTTLMIYFGTAERVSILLSLFLIPEPTIRRITTLLLRYVLPVAGPDVAHKAWVKVVSGLQHRLHRGALTRQLDYVYSEGDVIDLLVSKILLSWDETSSRIGPDAITVHASECVMLMRALYNHERGTDSSDNSDVENSTSGNDDNVPEWRKHMFLKFEQVADMFCTQMTEQTKSSSTPILLENESIQRCAAGLEVWARIFGAEIDMLRVGGRVYRKKNSDSSELKDIGSTLRIVRTEPLTSMVGVVSHDDPTEIITQVDSNVLIVREEITLKPHSLSNNMLDQLCRITNCISDNTTNQQKQSFNRLSLYLHRALNSPASDVNRIRSVPNSCWNGISKVAFRASSLSQFHTKEELENRHRILTTHQWRAKAMGPVLFTHTAGVRLLDQIKFDSTKYPVNALNSQLLAEEAAVLFVKMKGEVSLKDCVEEIRYHAVGKKTGVVGQSLDKLHDSLARLHSKIIPASERALKSHSSGGDRPNGDTPHNHGSSTGRRARKASSTAYESSRYLDAEKYSTEWSSRGYGHWTAKLVYLSLELHGDNHMKALAWLKQWGAFYMQYYKRDSSNSMDGCEIQNKKWICTSCTEENAASSTACEMCSSARPTTLYSPTAATATSASSTAEWKCNVCTFINPSSAGKCTMCLEPKQVLVPNVASKYKLPSNGKRQLVTQSSLLRQTSAEEFDSSALLDELDLTARTEIPLVINDVRAAARNMSNLFGTQEESKGESKGESKENSKGSASKTSGTLGSLFGLSSRRGAKKGNPFQTSSMNETPPSSIGGHYEGITKYTPMNTFPWKNMMVALPKFGTLALLDSVRDANHIVVSVTVATV